jgi:hypothetical protein
MHCQKEYLHDLEVDMVLKKTLLGLEDLQIGQEVPLHQHFSVNLFLFH